MMVDQSGGSLRELVAGATPVWLPDGKRLTFRSYAAGPTTCTMSADGADVRPLDNGVPDAKRSPKADEWAFAEGANLYVFDMKKPDERRALLEKTYMRVLYGFGWSPDGQWICFMGTTPDNNHELAVVHREGATKGFRVLVTRQSMADYLGANNFVAWEPKEGKQILASLMTRSNRNRQLYLLDAEGKAPPQRLAGQDATRSCVNGTWSPDGKKIVFCMRPGVLPSPQR